VPLAGIQKLAALKRYLNFSNYNRGSQTLNAVKKPTFWPLKLVIKINGAPRSKAQRPFRTQHVS
jgi:hypothetical protein